VFNYDLVNKIFGKDKCLKTTFKIKSRSIIQKVVIRPFKFYSKSRIFYSKSRISATTQPLKPLYLLPVCALLFRSDNTNRLCYSKQIQYLVRMWFKTDWKSTIYEFTENQL